MSFGRLNSYINFACRCAKTISYAALVTIVVLYIGITLHFILSPICNRSLHSILVHRLANLSEARNYYTIISSIATIITGFTGLLLGFFYYRHKLKTDYTNSRRDRIRNRIQTILTELILYEECVTEIINMRLDSDVSLTRIREKTTKRFDHIELILENNDKLLLLNTSDVQAILMVNSYVDKSDKIMSASYDNLNSIDFAEEKSTFCDLIRNAKRICYNNME